MARISGAIFTKLGRAPTILTMRIRLAPSPADSDREDMSNRREFDAVKEPRELLLFPRHADVVPNTMAPWHCLARLVRVEFLGMKREQGRLPLAGVHSADAAHGP